MARIVATEFISIDGVVEDPGGAEDFEYGGWSFDFDRGEDGNNFKLTETMESEALLLGRRTYEVFAASWPSREGEFADKFNSMPKYVVSTTLQNPEWNNTTVVGTDLSSVVDDLRSKHDGNIVVHGSTRLVQALLDEGLLDELRLMVFPVVLGKGKRLFAETRDQTKMKLRESRVSSETG